MRLPKRTAEQQEALNKIDSILESLTAENFAAAAKAMREAGKEAKGSPKQIKWAKDIIAASTLTAEQKEVALLGNAGIIIEHRKSAFLLLDYVRQLTAETLGLVSKEMWAAATPTKPSLPQPGTLGFIC